MVITRARSKIFDSSEKPQSARSILVVLPSTANENSNKDIDILLKRSMSSFDIEDNESFSNNSELSSMILLVVLYTLQGAIAGLTLQSIPFLVKLSLNSNVDSAWSYSFLGKLSLAKYPYSLKLLWSPIVDSVYSSSFGRRKSWVVPSQFATAIFLLYLSYSADMWLSDCHTYGNIMVSLFFVLVFLAATQDIAVDGWAVSMLSRKNLAYASTCQTVGLSAGFFISFNIFLSLRSPETAEYLGLNLGEGVGILSLNSYLFGWAIIFAVVTLWLIFFKTETTTTEGSTDNCNNSLTKKTDIEVSLTTSSNNGDANEIFSLESCVDLDSLSISGVYRLLWLVISLRSVIALSVLLLTCKIGFRMSDSLIVYALMERGFKQLDFVKLAFIQFPFDIIFAVLGGRWSRGPSPLTPFLFGLIGRLLLVIPGILIVYWADLFMVKSSDGTVTGGPSPALLCFALTNTVIASMANNYMFTAMCSFFARIADPRIGGSYMTLLATVSNFGGIWIEQLALYAMSSYDYYTISISGLLVGFILLFILHIPLVRYLQELPKTAWRVEAVLNKVE